MGHAFFLVGTTVKILICFEQWFYERGGEGRREDYTTCEVFLPVRKDFLGVAFTYKFVCLDDKNNKCRYECGGQHVKGKTFINGEIQSKEC